MVNGPIEIEYHVGDVIFTVERDQYHTDTTGFVTAFNTPGASQFIQIPKERVITIERVE